jgi:hypothetical protein
MAKPDPRKPAALAESISLETDSDWCQARSRRDDLRSQFQGKERELTDGRRLLAEHKAATEARAQRVAAGGSLDDGRHQEASLRQRLADGEEDVRILARALQISESAFEQETSRASRRLCERLRPRHEAIVQRIAAATAEVARLNEQEQALRAEIQRSGATNILPYLSFTTAGTLGDRQSAAVRYVLEAAAADYLPPDDADLLEIRCRHP